MRKRFIALARRHDVLLAIIIVVLGAVFACFSPEFLTVSNFVSLLESYSFSWS